MPWRDLPERYGPYTTAYNRFNRWSRRGIWKRVGIEISRQLGSDRQHDRESPPLSQRRKRGEKNQAIGISRGGRTTKIHAIVDSKGRPLNFTVTGGQIHDSQVVEDVLNTPQQPLAVTGHTIANERVSRSKTKGLYPSFPAVATRPGKPTVPSASIASAIRSKLSSVVSKIGGASPHETTSSLVTF